MTNEEVWELVLQKQEALKRICERLLMGARRSELEVMYSDVVLDRAVQIMSNFKPELGVPAEAYLVANVKWYAFKWVKGVHYRAYPIPVETLPDIIANSESSEHAERIQVYQLLDGLESDARDLIIWHDVEGYTYEEIGDYLGVSKTQVQKLYTRARGSAQALLEPEVYGS